MKKMLKAVLILVLFPILTYYILKSTSPFLGFIGLFGSIIIAIFVYRHMVYRVLSAVNYRKGDLQTALDYMKRSVNANRNNIESLIGYGYMLIRNGDFEKAGEILNRALNEAVTNELRYQVKTNIALVLWKTDRLDEAIEMLEEIIPEYKTTTIYGSLGYLLIEKGDLNKAMVFNLEAYDYNPDNTIIIDNLAHLYHLNGDLEKAEELFQKLMEKKPHFPDAYYNHAMYLEDVKKYDEAICAYQEALTKDFPKTSTITKDMVEERYKKLCDKVEGNKNE